jgi:hypothetical protein
LFKIFLRVFVLQSSGAQRIIDHPVQRQKELLRLKLLSSMHKNNTNFLGEERDLISGDYSDLIFRRIFCADIPNIMSFLCSFQPGTMVTPSSPNYVCEFQQCCYKYIFQKISDRQTFKEQPLDGSSIWKIK